MLKKIYRVGYQLQLEIHPFSQNLCVTTQFLMQTTTNKFQTHDVKKYNIVNCNGTKKSFEGTQFKMKVIIRYTLKISDVC